jgi:hypothetical protein
MSHLNLWQRAGLFTAGTALLLAVLLRLLSHVWWYSGTIWYRALVVLNYPAAGLSSLILDALGIPQLYGVPLPWHETLLIELTNFVLGMIWWFVLGAAISIVWQSMKKRVRQRVS